MSAGGGCKKVAELAVAGLGQRGRDEPAGQPAVLLQAARAPPRTAARPRVWGAGAGGRGASHREPRCRVTIRTPSSGRWKENADYPGDLITANQPGSETQRSPRTGARRRGMLGDQSTDGRRGGSSGTRPRRDGLGHQVEGETARRNSSSRKILARVE
ncbi:hypothetical protein GN956_G4323 [Arapaima gigas]